MRLKLITAILLTCLLLAIVLECCQQAEKEVGLSPNEYTGSASCQSCHKVEHDQWLTSHHFMAMQPANDSTVFGDFNNTVYTADGVTTKFFKRDGKFMMHTEDETGTYRDMEVKYTFGFTPLQQYLVEFPGGKMQATRMSWDTKANKWFHQYAGQKIPAGDWLHWTGNGQNWNTMCASCHSTNLQKGYDVETDTYKTTWNEINVSCESCHGPGKNHIDYVNGKGYQKGQKIKGSLLLLYKTGNRMAEINTCGFCHARRVDLTGNVLPGEELLQDYIPELPTTEYFYADGQMNDEDYNYTSFLQSKMFHRGVQCTSCHNPHTNGLKLNGALVCAQCHAQNTFASEQHTLHKVGTVGVDCISCHMPSKVYMGNDLRHDHSFRIPRPDLTAKYGTPNTCNSCHKDKTAQWAADALEKGYGHKPAYHWSEDLVPGSRMDEGSAPHLNKLTGDTSVPSIVRAAAIRYLAQLGNPQSGQTLLRHIADTSALVRHTVARGLRGYPANSWLGSAASLLQDPVRAIRLAAADLYLEVPGDQMPSGYAEAFSKAKSELAAFIYYQSDFAQGNLQAGDFFQRQGDQSNAEKFYRRAINKDSLMVAARVNLAATLNSAGRNNEALDQLETSARIEPRSDHIQYVLGLLYAEMGNATRAANALETATRLNPANVRAWYNRGLLLSGAGKTAEAEACFKSALKVDPFNGDVLNALAILYLQQGRMEEAKATATMLRQYHGQNPAYRDLLIRLKLL